MEEYGMVDEISDRFNGDIGVAGGKKIFIGIPRRFIALWLKKINVMEATDKEIAEWLDEDEPENGEISGPVEGPAKANYTMIKDLAETYMVKDRQDGGIEINIVVQKRYHDLWLVKLNELVTTDEEIAKYCDYDPRICYKDLRSYKYQLAEDYTIQSNITGHEAEVENYIKLQENGCLTIKKFYSWDGPSGPTIDTKTFMRGSLVHDAFYQLLREKKISRKYRKQADDLLRTVCLEDGMSKFRAWYVHKAVRVFAAKAAKPKNVRPRENISAP